MAGSGFVLHNITTGTLFEDPGAMADNRNWYYQVVAADACGNEEAGLP